MIHLVWSGKGFLVPVITFSACFFTELGVRAYFHDDQYYQKHGWPMLCALLMSGVLVGYIAPRLSRERTFRDLETGKVVVLKQNHTFLFIHIKYWGVILSVLGGLFYYLAETGRL